MLTEEIQSDKVRELRLKKADNRQNLENQRSDSTNNPEISVKTEGLRASFECVRRLPKEFQKEPNQVITGKITEKDQRYFDRNEQTLN